LGLTNKHQPIAKPGIGSGWTNIAELLFLTSSKYFQSAVARADGILIPNLHKALFVVQKARYASLLYNALRLHRSCTKFSLRSPFVQRAAAAPQLHKVLAALALRTTAVLQNSEKKSSLRSILFRNFAKPQRVGGHATKTLQTSNDI
jgi:hypothetical protein